LKKILLYPNKKRDDGFRITSQLAATLHSFGIAPVVADVAWFGVPDYVERKSMYEALSSADMLISLGGDGTILSIAASAAKSNLPILGINIGNVGFMTALDKFSLETPDGVSLLKNIIDGEYFIDRRMMLQAEVIRNGSCVFEAIALNDAVVSGDKVSRMVHLNLWNGGHFVSQFRGDGIIAATPTGSTAYSMSAGGPVVDPGAENLIITPICAHAYAVRSFVFSGKDVAYIDCVSSENSAYLTIDGATGIALSAGDRVKVSKSEQVCLLVRLQNYNFYDIISTKLR